jgi:hypothetical protein
MERQPSVQSLLPQRCRSLFCIPSTDLRGREKTSLSAFSTSLAKKHGKGEFYQAISSFSLPCFCYDCMQSTLERSLIMEGERYKIILRWFISMFF